MPRRLSRVTIFASLMATILAAGTTETARAEVGTAGEKRKIIDAGGGLDAIEITIDPAASALSASKCLTPNCVHTASFLHVPIPIPPSRIDSAKITIRSVAIGDGKHVALVRVPDTQRDDVAFEAIVSAHSPAPIFAGLTGFSEGNEGERSGQTVRLFDRDEVSKFVIVANYREDTRICRQQTTLLSPRGLDPKTMQLRAATLHRIDNKARGSAEAIVARARNRNAKPALAKILVATGASSPGFAALTDGNVDSTWSEQGPGDGHGEFVTMSAPAELPINALVITIAPTAPKARGVAPKAFFLATDDRLFRVTMPEDAWGKRGVSYEIPLPKAVHTTCMSVVLDEAYAKGIALPEVTIAEVTALSTFDTSGSSLSDVAKALAGPRAEEALALLKRAGNAGVTAVIEVYPTLDDKGRARAIDVAASAGSCTDPAMELVTRALGDKDVEVRRRALGAIERCGKRASAALATAVRSDDESRRAAAAPLLAAVAPNAALEPLASVMGTGSSETRQSIRSAFARAARTASPNQLCTLLGQQTHLAAAARLDLLRAMGPKLAECGAESNAAIVDLFQASPGMATRYLLAEPLAHLASSQNEAARVRLMDLVRHDPQWQVRARAVEVSAGIASLAATILAAAEDGQPRVRQAALRAIAKVAFVAGGGAAVKALTTDEWSFVRAAAAEAIGALPAEPHGVEAVGQALTDASVNVRIAALFALGQLRATTQASRVAARLDDTEETLDVRALAARTLGTMCVHNAIDTLTNFAERLRVQPASEADERIGTAAIEALSMLHPPDLPKRLAPLARKNVTLGVRHAAERAISNPGTCR
ncbi:MAG: HEAT repeat domain-containing protein [Polyangiaceae bacterium]|nr:HEAT repeat domain-containing protein [Polyangiaceae bacterium]